MEHCDEDDEIIGPKNTAEQSLQEQQEEPRYSSQKQEEQRDSSQEQEEQSNSSQEQQEQRDSSQEQEDEQSLSLSKERSMKTCKESDCPYCTTPPCGVCVACSNPARKKRCLDRWVSYWHQLYLITCKVPVPVLFISDPDPTSPNRCHN